MRARTHPAGPVLMRARTAMACRVPERGGHGLDPKNAADAAALAANGYTNVENYLNELAGDRSRGPRTYAAGPDELGAEPSKGS